MTTTLHPLAQLRNCVKQDEALSQRVAAFVEEGKALRAVFEDTLKQQGNSEVSATVTAHRFVTECVEDTALGMGR